MFNSEDDANFVRLYMIDLPYILEGDIVFHVEIYNMEQCTRLAIRLMTKHGLLTHGWRFGYDRAKTRCGICDYNAKTIKLSVHYVMDTSVAWGDIRNTILHEIAHAIAGYDASHGEVWKQAALSIGCNGSTCNTKWKGVYANYRLWCHCRRVDVLRYRLSSKFKKGVCAYCKTMNISKLKK